MLNHNSPIPIYIQLARILEDEIISKKLNPDEKLPSENILAKKFSVSRLTVRHSLDYLREKGYIVKKKGSGTFVRKDVKKEISIFNSCGITEAFKRENLKLKKILVEKLTTKRILTNDNPFFNEEVYYFSRLDIVEMKRIIFERFYLDKNLFKNLEKFNLENSQISEIAEKEYYLKISKIKQNFKSIITDTYLKKIFHTHNKPLLFLKREIFFNNKCGIFSEIFIDTDSFEFVQEIGG